MWLKSLAWTSGDVILEIAQWPPAPGSFLSLFIPPLLHKIEIVRPASIAIVARQLNAKFWNRDNSVFQALKSAKLSTKNRWRRGRQGQMKTSDDNEGKCAHYVVSRLVVLFILADDCQPKIVFFHRNISGDSYGAVLWKCSWQIILQGLSPTGLLSGKWYYGWHTENTVVSVVIICLLHTPIHFLPPFKE